MSLNIFETAKELEKFRGVSRIHAEARKISTISRAKEDLKGGVELLESYLKSNKHHAAVSITLAMIIVDADGAIARIRRSGILSMSKYEFRAGGIQRVIDAIFSLDSLLAEVQVHRINYLISLKNLIQISRDAEKIYKRLVARLHAKKKYVLKSLLAFVNHLFSIPWRGDPEMPSNDLRRWSQEDMAEAYSYIFNLMREKVGFSLHDWQHVDDSMTGNFDNSYGEILMDAAVLQDLREAEYKVESMPYTVAVEGRTYHLFSENEDFDKTIQLGYIQTNKQIYIRARGILYWLKPTPPFESIEEFVSLQFKGDFSSCVILAKEPISRYVVCVPFTALPILAGDFLFSDEVSELVGLSIENFEREPDDPRKILIGRTLTAGDAIHIQRYFRFLKAIFDEHFNAIENSKEKRILRARSTLPIIKNDVFLQQLSLLIGKEKAQEAIELLSLDTAHKFVDIQYRPFIKAGEWYVLAPAVIGYSNLARNIAIANGLRQKLIDPKNDPMQGAVSSALTKAGFKVKTGHEYNIDGKRETDIFCWRDGHLFVFECKNSYLPCSAHELSNTFEHLKTAEKQLSIRKRWLEKSGNKEKLLKSLKWDVPVSSIHTAVITANRLFTGFKQGEHPSRQAHEFINVILRGKIEGEGLPIKKFWKEDDFTTQDLVAYLDDGGIAKMQLDKLQVLKVRTDIGSASLTKLMYFELPECRDGCRD